jgi:hypothetical protein
MAGGGAIYGLGVFGAAVYFIQGSVGFGPAFFGILKAIVWPALVVYRVLGLLKL